MRSDFKIGSLEKPPNLADIAAPDSRVAFHALCCFIWATIEDRGQDFATPEDVADYLETPEQQAAGLNALRDALEEAGIIKKKVTDHENAQV